MTTPPTMERPVLATRPCRAISIIGVLSVALAFAVGTRITSEPPSVEVAPVTVTLPPPPASVSVTAPVCPVPEPLRLEPPPIAEVPPPPPRRLTPMLDAKCVQSVEAHACNWDDGFPAISGDGTVIASKHYSNRGEHDINGLEIRLTDTKRSRRVSTIVIMTNNELATYEDRDRLQALIDRRVASVQRTLDARDYRTMGWLGECSPDAEPVPSTSDRIHSECLDDAVRIVDPKTATILWQHRFTNSCTRTDDCSSYHTLWWDPSTKHILVDEKHTTHDCMGDTAHVQRIWRMR